MWHNNNKYNQLSSHLNLRDDWVHDDCSWSLLTMVQNMMARWNHEPWMHQYAYWYDPSETIHSTVHTLILHSMRDDAATFWGLTTLWTLHHVCAFNNILLNIIYSKGTLFSVCTSQNELFSTSPTLRTPRKHTNADKVISDYWPRNIRYKYYYTTISFWY